MSETAQARCEGIPGMSDFFLWLGIHPQFVVIGLLGAIARTLIPPFLPPWSTAAYWLLGALVGGFFTTMFVHVLGLSGDFQNFAAFVCGACAPLLLETVIRRARSINLIGGNGQ